MHIGFTKVVPSWRPKNLRNKRVPYRDQDVLVRDGLEVESHGGNRRKVVHMAMFEPVQQGSFTAGIVAQHQDVSRLEESE